MNHTRTAIVTGAGDGIGREIATTLADNDWNVAVNDVNLAAATATTEKIISAGGMALPVSGDIGNEADVRRIFEQIPEKYPNPATLLVNNAGVQTWSPLSTLSAEDWQKTLNTNLTGCFLMTKYFAAAAQPGSAIVNIGSGCNKLAFPNLVDYSASKGGIEMFTKSAALELGPQGMRVNCIAPGAIATDRTAAETDDYERSWAELTPLQRVGTPNDIANAVLLLVDDKAGFITGQTINVDGGLFSRAVWPAGY